MYCPECGCKIEEKDARFCPECGTRIQEHEDYDKTVKDVASSKSLCGLILTNVFLLSQKFQIDESAILSCLSDFIQGKEKHGIHYRLIDVGNYTFYRKNVFGFTKTAHHKTQISLWDCMEILMDVHQHELNQSLDLSKYLFIIGGDDIIPMSCVRHFTGDCPDSTIDTDVLYGYPYGKEALEMLEKGVLFEQSPLFMVGRLPIEKDTTKEDLYDYLERSLKNSHGIPMKEAYAQSDPNWKNVSATVADNLIRNDWLRNLDGHLPNDYYFHRLILSPRIDVGNVSQVFRPDASLYYYNLHGSNDLEDRGYYGCTTSKLMNMAVLNPEHMCSCVTPNIVVCEACYGARFIGLDKWHSMLLSSIYSETLLFVGSSRIAWGAEDPHFMTGYERLEPQCADVVAHTFIDRMIQGYSSGEAMLLARIGLLEKEYTPHALASVVEFNLFGDPTLSMGIVDAEPVDFSACKIHQGGYVMEKVDMPDTKHIDSPLQRVRQAVDNNIWNIQNAISDYLYRSYGIEPRPVSHVYRMEYLNGNKELNFTYRVYSDKTKPMDYVVRTTEEGKVKNVIVTK